MNILLLQWNIWCKEDIQNIAQEIRKIQPDIVCVQELIQDVDTGTDAAKELSEALGYPYVYFPAETWDNEKGHKTQGNGIFSRFPILASRSQHIKPALHNPPDAAHEGRVYGEIDVDIGGTMLTVGTTHLSFTPFFTETPERIQEVENFLSIMKTKKERYLFTGDLNAPPQSYLVTELKKYLVHAGPPFSENTWTTKPFEKLGMKEQGLNWRLDYVLSSRDISTISSETVQTNLSDHLPIFVTFHYNHK